MTEPEIPELFDSHLHLTASRFGPDRDAVLTRARAAGVTGMVTVASSPEDAAAAIALAEREAGVWATAGLHPHEADRADAGLDAELERLAAAPEVVALGETGLDFHYDNSDRAAQVASFETHLALGARLGLPVVVHSRSAVEETAALVADRGGETGGVLHCFTGGRALLEAGLRAGWYVSFAGLATFAPDVARWVGEVPRDRLLIETDAPYLSPAPRRGRRNEPAYLTHTCRRVAELAGLEFEEAAALTRANARRFYGLDAG